MLKNKILGILFVVVMLLCTFAGCANNSNKNTPQNTETSEKTSTAGSIGGKLVIWEHTPQFEEPLKAVVKGFNEQYPDVEIEIQVKSTDQYYNLLATTIQAGEVPDLFWTNGRATSNLSGFVEQGVVMDVTDKLDKSLFTQEMIDFVTIDGKIYASPTVEVGGRAVFYNKDIFNELSIDIPTTFEEFEQILKKLKAEGILPISLSALDPWSILFQFEPVLAGMSLDWLEESNEGLVKVNDSRVVAAYNKMLEWADKGYYGPGYTGVDEGGSLLAFSTEQAAMTIHGTWNILTIQENNPDLNFGAFQIPTADGTRPFVGTSSCGFSVSNNTKYEEAAIAFLNYFASVAGQSAWINSLNAIPGVPEVVSNDPVIQEVSSYDVMAASFYDILGRQAKDGENPGKVWEENQTKVFSGGITPQEFTDDLQSMIKE